MKKILLMSICFGILACGIWSVEAKDDMHQPAKQEMKMHEKLAEKLNLTAEQKEKADKIREEGRKEMKPLIQEKKRLHEKMDKIRKENMEKFENILTSEQKEIFEKIKKEHRPPHDKDFHGKKHHGKKFHDADDKAVAKRIESK